MDETREAFVRRVFDGVGLSVSEDEAEALARGFSACGKDGAGKVFRRLSDELLERTVLCGKDELARFSGISFTFSVLARLSEALAEG